MSGLGAPDVYGRPIMRTYYVFQGQNSPGLRAFTDTPEGEKLPAEDGPWTLVQKISPDEDWDLSISRFLAVVAAGIMENGFYIYGPINRPDSSKSIIESDRVEGTAVFDSRGDQIGTIKRLLIEKTSGRVLYVDVTFGGFLGIGAHHHTIPWDKLSYDREYSAYRTDLTAEQVHGALVTYGNDEVFSAEREKVIHDYWRDPHRGSV
jgi:sporulation protein YlmC with PRC-barrel domain